MKIYTAANAIILHKEPSIISEILSTIPNGGSITILEEQEKWAKIKYNGIEGYILKQFIYNPEITIKQYLITISSYIDLILKELEIIDEGKV